MELQRLYSYTRKALDSYHMIEDGDKLAVGLSGGKDSLTLLYALAGLRRFYPKRFEVVGITVDLGIPGMDFAPVEKLCEQLDVEYHIVATRIQEIVFDVRKEKHPCSLCAKLRKGALNERALELRCNKLAYAHHRDDFVETLYMSLMYEGRLHTFSPVTKLDRTNLTLIRPLMLIPEPEIIGFQRKQRLPVVKNFCPADGATKRQEMKVLLRQLKKENSQLMKHSFSAILGAEFSDWPRMDQGTES